jgi:hypothetical protein
MVGSVTFTASSAAKSVARTRARELKSCSITSWPSR